MKRERVLWEQLLIPFTTETENIKTQIFCESQHSLYSLRIHMNDIDSLFEAL